jgi:hypothetical protein
MIECDRPKLLMDASRMCMCGALVETAVHGETTRGTGPKDPD